jgi:hypothetical protein
MSEDESTAAYFAALREFNGLQGGPGIVIVDIWQSRWKILLSLGAVDSATIARLPGQTQAFVPIDLFPPFEILKTRYTSSP